MDTNACGIFISMCKQKAPLTELFVFEIVEDFVKSVCKTVFFYIIDFLEAEYIKSLFVSTA